MFSEHDFMFQNMKSCLRTWFHVKIMFYDLNTIWTSNHVREHEIMFQNMIHVLKHRACFWNTISCYGTWNHVMEHEIMFKACFNVLNILWTWLHVREHEIMFQNMKSCYGTWNHVQIMFDSNRHVQDCACMMFTACNLKSNHKSCNMETLKGPEGVQGPALS